MFFSPCTVRNEFVDPAPQDQALATLVLNRQRIACRLMEVSLGGFCVRIERATTWKGEPVGRLITHDSSYPVRILKQEARYEGFDVSLQRLEESSDLNLTKSQQWIIHGSRCCAIGLILAITYCLVCRPGGVTRGPAHAVSLRSALSYWFQGWSANVPSGPKTVGSAATDDDSTDMPAIAVSLAANGSTGSHSNRVIDRDTVLRAAMIAADSTRSRPVNATTLPWLFPASIPVDKDVPHCRISAQCEKDLQLFEACLKALPKSAADDAIQSLRSAFAGIGTSPASAIAGFPHVRLIRSEDAEIFFRTVDGEVEVLRLLPIELDVAAPARGPSASASPHSRHR